jgi:hypothetical protein
MLVCASIIAQPIEPQGNKNFAPTIMQGNYAGFRKSVVVIVDFFARQALAGFWRPGLVSAWSDREGLPGASGRRASFDGLQPIIDKPDRSADLGFREVPDWFAVRPVGGPALVAPSFRHPGLLRGCLLRGTLVRSCPKVAVRNKINGWKRTHAHLRIQIATGRPR